MGLVGAPMGPGGPRGLCMGAEPGGPMGDGGPIGFIGPEGRRVRERFQFTSTSVGAGAAAASESHLEVLAACQPSGDLTVQVQEDH